MKNRKIIILSVILFAFIALKCKDDPKEQTPENYDRGVLLTNLANNNILPAYENYHSKVSDLHSALNSFVSSPSEAALNSCRNLLENATIAWQSVAFFEFGPAESISLRAQTNIYPVDTSLIVENITSNTYNLQQPSNFDAKGLQALDYLLFNPAYTSDADLVSYFQNTSNAGQYLMALVDELKANALTVKNAWQTYKNTFTGSTSNNAQGSAVSNLINSISLHYEAFVRKGKVGIPLGVFNGISQAILPDRVEGFYSGKSKEYAIASIEALQKIIKGSHFNSNTNGEGLDNYLDHVKAKYGNDNLSIAIENQINQVISNLNGINTSINQAISTSNADVTTTYQSMQQLVPLIKVEMTSALGVLISYQDNDGD